MSKQKLLKLVSAMNAISMVYFECPLEEIEQRGYRELDVLYVTEFRSLLTRAEIVAALKNDVKATQAWIDENMRAAA